MAFSYTLVKNQDVYTLSNLLPGETLRYNLEKTENCSTYNSVQSGTLTISGGLTPSVVLSISEDGEYRLTLTDESLTNEIVFIKYYLNLQKSLVLDMDLALCGCECQSCEECQDCELLLSTVTKFGAFAALSAIDYTLVYTTVSNYLKCFLGDDVSCVLVNEKYKGSADVTNTLRILLSLYYLIMYFTEFNAAADSAEESYVNTKFNYEVISKCIIKLGINISDIEALL